MAFLFPDKYIDPLTDFGFKRLFGTEPHKALLIDFLNTLLPEYHHIQDVTFKNPESIGRTWADRKAIFDIYCQTDTGERFIVEIQKAKQRFFKDRSVYYSTFPIQEQARTGPWDYELAAVYTVGVLDFIFDEHKQEETLIHTVELKDQNCQVFYDKLKFIYIELPKFKKTLAELSSHTDKWLFVLRHLAQLEAPPSNLQEGVFNQLFEVAKIANFSETEQALYQESLKVYRDNFNATQTLIEETDKKAREEGKEEERRQIVQTMKSAGLPIAEIARFTGLSEQEIREL